MKTIKKALLTIGDFNELAITEKDLNIYIPINRYLDEVGFYEFDFINLNGKEYLIVFDESEKYSKKTKILVSRNDELENKLIDITPDDYKNLEWIYDNYMIKPKNAS